jgi:hypothetical protein
VFEHRVLRIIFRPKRDELTGQWRKQHIEELTELYSSTKSSSGDKIEKNEKDGACSAYGGEEKFIL